jgi:hypothetical protein
MNGQRSYRENERTSARCIRYFFPAAERPRTSGLSDKSLADVFGDGVEKTGEERIKAICEIAWPPKGTPAERATQAAKLALAQSGPVSNGVVKIGVLGDMAGLYQDTSGKGAVEAVKSAVEDFGGAVLGKPIEIVSADHQNKPNIADRRHLGQKNVALDAHLLARKVQGRKAQLRIHDVAFEDASMPSRS